MLEKKKLAPFFKRKLTSKISNTYIDLHMHTTASDGFIKPQVIRKLFANKSHLIAVTDHNAIKNSIVLSQNYNLNIIPGIEVGCHDGFEFLIYFNTPEELEDFYHQYVQPFKRNYDITRTNQDHIHFLNAAAKYDAFISIPHISGLAQKNYFRNKDYI